MKKRGFTLIELILAIFLFSYGIVSVIQILPVNRRLLSQSALLTQATFLATEQVEIVREVSYTDLTLGTYEARAALPGDYGAYATQFERSTEVSLIDGNYAATNTDVGLKKVVITVFWSDNNVAQSYVLTTYTNDL